MKKILLLLPIILGLLACTTDNEEDFGQYEYYIAEKSDAPGFEILSTTCFTNLTGQTHVDVSGGFGNPIVVFTPTVTGTVPATAKFRVKVEVQPLSDCDNINSDTSTLLNFGHVIAQNIVAAPPVISVQPENLPLCYKWRFVFEGISDIKRNPICYSASDWYESPLF